MRITRLLFCMTCCLAGFAAGLHAAVLSHGDIIHEVDTDCCTSTTRTPPSTKRHDVTLPGGEEVVIYNMHMDASNNRDEMKHNDGKDKAARLAQWQQLRDYIMAHLDGRPVIVAGDMNSLYHRDPVKTQFIDAINASGKATCGDVWIEQTKGGTYPQTGGEPLADETLDKILYINPTDGNQITPMGFTLDTEGYQYEGRAMGDHYPIIAELRLPKH